MEFARRSEFIDSVSFTGLGKVRMATFDIICDNVRRQINSSLLRGHLVGKMDMRAMSDRLLPENYCDDTEHLIGSLIYALRKERIEADYKYPFLHFRVAERLLVTDENSN